MRCLAAFALVLLVRGSSLALSGSSKASDDVKELFVTTCVRYAISLIDEQRTPVATVSSPNTLQVARNCQIHLSKSGDFCTGYAELVDRRADQATLNQFCLAEYQKLHAASLPVSNGTQQIQMHAQSASSHAGSEEATLTPEQKTCQERVENIIRLQLPQKAASKVVRLDCAQRFGRGAPLCKDVVKLFGQGNVRDTCKLLARKRLDMGEFCRHTTGKMVGTGLYGGALREAARDLCEMEFEQAPPLHVHEGCSFYADRLAKAHLDGSSNVSYFCAKLTQRPPSRQAKAAPVVAQKARVTSTNAGQQTNFKALSSAAAHHSNPPTAEQRRPAKAASIGKAPHSDSPVQPLASAAKPRTSKALDSLHAVSRPSGARKASTQDPAKPSAPVQIPKTNTPAAAPKVVATARRNTQSVANTATSRTDALAVAAPVGVRAISSSSGRIIPSLRPAVPPQKTGVPTKGVPAGASPKTKKQADKTAAAPVSHPLAAATALVPPTGVAAAAVPTDAEHSADSFFGVPDAGTVDGVLSAMASMPTALPLSEVATVPAAEAAQQQSPQQRPMAAAARSKAAPQKTQANAITVKTSASMPAASSEATATAAEDNFLSNFLGQYDRNPGPKNAAVQHDPAAQQKAIPIPDPPPGTEALTAALTPADVVVGPGVADVDALVSSFLARSG